MPRLEPPSTNKVRSVMKPASRRREWPSRWRELGSDFGPRCTRSDQEILHRAGPSAGVVGVSFASRTTDQSVRFDGPDSWAHLSLELCGSSWLRLLTADYQTARWETDSARRRPRRSIAPSSAIEHRART